jgi:hypothetical protein
VVKQDNNRPSFVVSSVALPWLAGAAGPATLIELCRLFGWWGVVMGRLLRR